MLLLGEDGVGELCVSYLLGVGFFLHEGEDLRTGQVFWDLFYDVLLKDQLAIAFFSSLVFLSFLSLLIILLLFLVLLLLFFFFLLLFLLLLFLLFLLLLLLVLVLSLGRLLFLRWLLLITSNWLIWLNGLIQRPLLIELVALNGLLIALLERWLLWILEVDRLVQIARLLIEVSLLWKVGWWVEVRWWVVASLLLIVIPLLVEVIAVVYLFPIMRSLLTWIWLRGRT